MSKRGLPPIVVRPLSGGADDLQNAVQMAKEWGENPFDAAKAQNNLQPGHSRLHSHRPAHSTLLATRNGEIIGMLRAEVRSAWTHPRPFAFAPMVWTRGADNNNAQIPQLVREKAALKLVREFLQHARAKKLPAAKLVFRAGMIPDPAALAGMGLRRQCRVFIRKTPLPGDITDRRVRWFSTQNRPAKGMEMDLPFEKMFPELFAEKQSAPPPVRRLQSADSDDAMEVARASRNARGLPFSEAGFRRLFRDAVSRRDRCALAVDDESASGAKLCGVVIGASSPHPFADGRVSRAVVLEWRTSGAKSARRAISGLWRGFALWSARGLCRAMLVAPPEGKFGDEFIRRNRLMFFGTCWTTELNADDADETENAG